MLVSQFCSKLVALGPWPELACRDGAAFKCPKPATLKVPGKGTGRQEVEHHVFTQFLKLASSTDCLKDGRTLRIMKPYAQFRNSPNMGAAPLQIKTCGYC